MTGSAPQSLPPSLDRLVGYLAGLGFPLPIGDHVLAPWRTDQVIETAADIARLQATGRRPMSIVVAVPNFSADERGQAASRLDSLSRECGCRAGAIAMGSMALILLTVLAAHTIASGRWPTLSQIGLAGGLILAAALIGKVWGLVTAAVRWRHELGRIEAAIRPAGGPPLEIGVEQCQQNNTVEHDPLRVRP